MTSLVDEELLELLQNPQLKKEARIHAWEYLLGLTVTDEGLNVLLQSRKLLPFVLFQIETSDVQAVSMAYKLLINFSRTLEGASALLAAKKDIVVWLLNCVSDTEGHSIEEGCYLLSNISNHCNVCDEKAVMNSFHEILKKLMAVFCAKDSVVREKYKFLALLFSNVSKYEEGRKLLIKEVNFIQSLLSCTKYEEADIRRLGVALTIRNCCLETSSHQKLLEELNILPYLLLPLMGGEDYEEERMEQLPIECQYLEETKEREKLPQIRRALVHALCLLCYTEEGWNYLKSRGVYHVTRQLHMWEQDPDVSEAAETLIGYMLVMQYTAPESASSASYAIPSETDILKDIPDFVI